MEAMARLLETGKSLYKFTPGLAIGQRPFRFYIAHQSTKAEEKKSGQKSGNIVFTNNQYDHVYEMFKTSMCQQALDN